MGGAQFSVVSKNCEFVIDFVVPKSDLNSIRKYVELRVVDISDLFVIKTTLKKNPPRQPSAATPQEGN